MSEQSKAEDTRNKEAVEPSGNKGDNPSTSGPGKTEVHSNTPENAGGKLNPSAPASDDSTPPIHTETIS